MTSTETKMQSVIVTYPNGRSELQTALIPKPPPHKLEEAFQYDSVLYLRPRVINTAGTLTGQ